MDGIVQIINSGLRMTTPIAFCTLGAIVSEKAGINALAMEGVMLAGAFGAVLGSALTGSAWLGLLFAMACSILISSIRAYLCIEHQADQTVSGVGVNILVSGLTALLLKIIWNLDGKSDTVASLSDWRIPLLDHIPFLGDILAKQNPLVYLLFPVLIAMCILMGKSCYGLRISAAGEHPEVLTSLGLSVARHRYIACILSGALAGLGGAYLSIGQLSFFSMDMTSGRGFMALAACIFGGWSPLGGFVGSLIFGFAEAIQMRLQSFVRYTQFVQMIPYLITLAVLSGFVRKRVKPPSASGKPYREQE